MSDLFQSLFDSESDDKKTLMKLQRELADAIIRQRPADELREILALGAQVNEPMENG